MMKKIFHGNEIVDTVTRFHPYLYMYNIVQIEENVRSGNIVVRILFQLKNFQNRFFFICVCWILKISIYALLPICFFEIFRNCIIYLIRRR